MSAVAASTLEVMGTGNHRYKFIPNWLDIPLPCYPNDVAVDAQDRVYISQPQDPRGDKGLKEAVDAPLIVVCDRDSNLLGTWGSGACLHSHGLYIAHDILYICDKDASKCMMYTLDGKILRVIGEHNVHAETGAINKVDPVLHQTGPFNFPAKLVPSPWGDLYVADGYKNARIHRFHSNGQLIQSWGKWGRKRAGNFYVPHSVLATADGRVYVASRFTDNVQIFDRYGEFITLWPKIRRPADVIELPDGNIAVCEHPSDYFSSEIDFSIPFGVTIFNKDGEALSRLDTGLAHGMAVDSRGDIYLTNHHTVNKCVRL